jgi:hypothetical protein
MTRGSRFQTHSFPSRVLEGAGRFLMRWLAVCLIDWFKVSKKHVKSKNPSKCCIALKNLHTV